MKGTSRRSPAQSIKRIVSFVRRSNGSAARHGSPGGDISAVEARLAADVQAVRCEIESQTTALRMELHAFAGSLHASTIARLDALHTRVESDLMALLMFRQAPDSELESELTDSMRLVIERATADIRQALLDRSDLNMRVLEQELVRVTSRLESRLDEIASGNPAAAPSRAPIAREP